MFQITGTPSPNDVKKVSANMDDVLPQTAEKAAPMPPVVAKPEEEPK